MADKVVEIVKPAEAQKPKQPLCDPHSLLEGVTNILKKIKDERGHPLFAFITHEIDDEVFDEVYKWRNELKEAGKTGQVDILINSPGGNLTSCYNLARLFSRCANSWEALVPAYAASGATLICLGSFNIVMSEISQLGPLDPQVISRRREKFFQSERQSPLEAFAAVRYLRRFSLESLDAVMLFLLEHQVAPQLALTTARDMAIHLVEPILGKIEPYDVGSFALDSRIAIEYCKRIGDPENKDKKTQRNVDSRVLVETYPAHEFVIDIEEARALNFKVSEPTSKVDNAFDELRGHLESIHHYIGFLP